MVGPSVSDADRASFARKLKIGFALLVGLSMALVTVYGDAPLTVALAALIAGTAAGGALAWWIIPDMEGPASGR